MNLFRPKQEKKPVAMKPSMTETHLKNIRMQAKVFYEQCGGKGTLSLEQLENHAIISAWNAVAENENALDLKAGDIAPPAK
jgi:hypothetical protein